MNRLALACVCLLYLVVGWVQTWPDGLLPVRAGGATSPAFQGAGQADGGFAEAVWLRPAFVEAGESSLVQSAGVVSEMSLRANPDLIPPPDNTYLQPVEMSERSASDGMVAVGVGGPGPDSAPGGVGPEREWVSDRSGRVMEVRATWYTDRGTTRYNCNAGPGIVAVDPSVIPPMSIIRFDGASYLACDTGTGRGAWVDFWQPSEAAGRAFTARYGDYAEVEIGVMEP